MELRDRIGELSSELAGIRSELLLLEMLTYRSQNNVKPDTIGDTLFSIGQHIERIGNELDTLSKS